ncbi:MAG: hypothetical protein IT252_15925 [Chitinophagaceae bacterium]|nr:hypothetical protein [Chitinophagaceae bacterium]
MGFYKILDDAVGSATAYYSIANHTTFLGAATAFTTSATGAGYKADRQYQNQ